MLKRIPQRCDPTILINASILETDLSYLYYGRAIILSSPKGISSRAFSEAVHLVQWLFVAIIYLLDYIYTDCIYYVGL